MATMERSRVRTGAVERERAELDRTLYYAQRFEAIAERADASAAEQIRRLIKEQADESRPLRVRLVRDLLEVSDHTIVDWCKLGILEERGESPRRITLLSVLKVKEAVEAIRSAGEDRNLTAAVLNKLEFEELQENDRFRKSLGQAKRGERGEWPENF